MASLWKVAYRSFGLQEHYIFESDKFLWMDTHARTETKQQSTLATRQRQKEIAISGVHSHSYTEYERTMTTRSLIRIEGLR